MKLKLGQINPNPFKKEINHGRLDKEQVKRIKSNIQELGLMGSLPIYKKDGKYFLIAGHHRVMALKETYGNNFEVEVVVHNYNEEQVMRGMVVENLTQRTDDFREINENLVMIRKYLKKNPNPEPITDKERYGIDHMPCSTSEHGQKRTNKGKFDNESGSIRHIASWLNKNGEVMSIGKISEHLKIYDNLDKELYEKVEKTHKGNAEKRTDGETISFVQAEMLSRFEDKKEQKELTKVLLNSQEQRVREQGKLLTIYKEAPENVKKKIREQEVDLLEVETEIHKSNVGHINLSREKIYLENHIELRENLSKLFTEKMFLKKSPSGELETTYHYLLNWIKKDLIPFMKAIEDEYKSRGKKEDIVFFDFIERRKS